MCLAVPGKIVEVDDRGAEAALSRVGTIDFQGTRIEASLAMTPEAGVGDWVLVHAGFALAVLDEEEARKTYEVFAEAVEAVEAAGAAAEAPDPPPAD